MVPAERELPLTVSALEALLVQLPGAFQLCEGERQFWGALPDRVSRHLDPLAGLTFGQLAGGPAAAAQLDALTEDFRVAAGKSAREDDFPEWVGVLPYEAFRGLERRGGAEADRRPRPEWVLPKWCRYPAVVERGPSGLRVRGQDRRAVERLVDALLSRAGDALRRTPRLELLQPVEESEVHERRVLRALEAIARGDLYQVNLARRFSYRAEGHPLDILRSLGKRGAAPYAAALSWGEHGLVSLSPELFLDVLPDGLVRTRPIKGTRPRTGDAERDARAAAELDACEKERAELAMVIDIERNDLGRLAVVGSVRLSEAPSVVEYPTILHREAQVEARLRAGTSLEALLLATMPSGSITGAPKVRAMEWIAELEAHRRGIYTGAIGTLSHHGRLRLSMAIRTLTLKKGHGHYFSGGGIVADSDPAREVEETLWKVAPLQGSVIP